MDCGESKSGWNVLQDTLALYLKSEQIQPDPACRNYFKTGNNKFFILPLCELEGLRDIRKITNDYDSHVIFLISDEDEKPCRFNKKLQKKDREELFGNPKFGNISQAILCGEIITLPASKDSPEDIKSNCTVQQFVNINDKTFPENLYKTLNKLLETRVTEGNNINSSSGKFRRMFYDTFVDYYFPKNIDFRIAEECYGGETGLNKIIGAMPSEEFIDKFVSGDNAKEKSMLALFINLYKKCSWLKAYDAKFLMTLTDVIYCSLNGLDYDSWTHRVEHEFFRAPIPFPLHELISAKNFVEEILHERGRKKRIKLLLIDNRLDKVMPTNGGGGGGLLEVIFHKEIAPLFELRMLGGTTGYNKDNTQTVFDESDKFNFEKFKNALNEIETGKPQDTELVNNHAFQVYKKIKEAHFVLLDFFLNEENTYLAFDFIKDICDIKKAAGDYSTTWFFITSAVYDSVVKYSQSGLLAEYYESAVVSAGDDPTNPKRQIIFIYKLLTFIKARLSTFNRYRTSIEERLLDIPKPDKDQEGQQQKTCKEYSKDSSSPCKKGDDCLQNLQVHIKKYLTEFDDVASIFYGTSNSGRTDEIEIKEIKAIIESLDNLINQFLWLPEADWYIIQHQVDFINEKLKKLNVEYLKKCKFSCGYILKELRNRSEAY